jgi:hypothetical protein
LTWRFLSQNGGPEWERVSATAYECSRIPRAFLEEERAVMGERWFRQEYLCEFVSEVSGVFDRDAVRGTVSSEVVPLRIG